MSCMKSTMKRERAQILKSNDRPKKEGRMQLDARQRVDERVIDSKIIQRTSQKYASERRKSGELEVLEAVDGVPEEGAEVVCE